MEVEVRQYTLNDVPAMHEAIVESLDHLRPWMPWVAHEPLTLPKRTAMVRRWLDEGTENLVIVVDGIYAGGTGLHDRIGPTGREIGYWVRASMIGRGIATEAALQLTERALAVPGVDHVEDPPRQGEPRVAAGAREARLHPHSRGRRRDQGSSGVRHVV